MCAAKTRVNVHVVATRKTCPALMRSPTMLAYEQRAPLSTRQVGAHSTRGAGLHSDPRSQGGGVGGHGPAVAAAAGTDLANLIAPTIERSTSSAGQAAAAQDYRASAWWAAWTRGACVGLGAYRAGGRGRPRQARALSALPAALAGGGSAAPAAAGDRDPARDAGSDRVSVAPTGLLSVWRSDAGGGAAGGPYGGIRSTGAGDHRPVHRGLSPVEAHDPSGTGRPFRRLAGAGYSGQPGAGDDPGGGSCVGPICCGTSTR